MEEASVAIFSNDVMVEIVSWLPVKYVMQLRCLNKFFDTLIFDPYFVKMHLNKSTRYPQLSLMYFENENENHDDDDDNPEDWTYSLITLSVPCLLQNQLNIVHRSNPYYLSNDDYSDKKPHRSGILPWVVGSCNGLLCLFGVSHTSRHQWFCLWNPATRKKSEKFTLFFDSYNKTKHNFSFGYNNSTQTYKVVAFYVKVKPHSKPKSVVKVLSLGDNYSWRDIQCLPVLPICCLLDDDKKNDGVHLNGTINWIAFHNDIDMSSRVTVDQLLILSLDLSTETYTQFLLPRRFDAVLRYPRKLVLLMDCLCFCHDFEKTHFVIWQMKDFGVQESWIQLFNISYQHFYTWRYFFDLLPLYLSDNGDTLVLTNVEHTEVFIYNRRDNKVEQIGNHYPIKWSMANDFVESLVSTH